MCRRVEDYQPYLSAAGDTEISEERDFEVLERLKTYEDKPQRAAPRKRIAEKEVRVVPFDDGWPGYDKPIFEQ